MDLLGAIVEFSLSQNVSSTSMYLFQPCVCACVFTNRNYHVCFCIRVDLSSKKVGTLWKTVPGYSTIKSMTAIVSACQVLFSTFTSIILSNYHSNCIVRGELEYEPVHPNSSCSLNSCVLNGI